MSTGGKINFEAITSHLGDFGKYQQWVFFLACIGSFAPAMVVVCMTFVGNNVNHRCAVPSCDNANSTYEEDFLNFTIPWEDTDDTWDECKRYELVSSDVNSTECSRDNFKNKTVPCDSWVYDTSVFQSTTVTEFDLTCDRSSLTPLAGSMYMVGMLLGAVTIGDLGDRFGRKFGILVSVLLLSGGGVLSAVSPNYIMFLIMRLFTGAGGVGLFQVTFVLAVEFIGAKWRTFCGIIIEVPFALGEATTGVLAYFIREWRWLQVAVTAPVFLLVSYMWLLPESVRWLVSQGRRDDAIKIIEKVAKFNKASVPKHLLEEPKTKLPPVQSTLSVGGSTTELIKEDPSVEIKEAKKPKRTLIDLLKYPNMRRRTLNLFYCWSVCTLVYYGLSINSGNLGGDIFVNFIATMLIEIPSYIFSYFVLDRMGRKGTLSFVLLLGGVACLISGFTPSEMNGIVVAFSLVGKFGIAAAFAIVYVYSAEIFPTEYRSVGIGSCSMCARIGGIIAPFIAKLADVYNPLPLLIFGALSFSSGLMVILLPETVGCELPQTLQESEQFGKDQSILHFVCSCTPVVHTPGDKEESNL